jgi:hypothetical protein
MTHARACPVGREKIDATAARINGGFVAAILVIAMVTGAPWLIAFLIVDILIKVSAGFAYSPMCAITRGISQRLRLQSRPIDSAPKRFAALIALTMGFVSITLAYAPVPGVWFYGVAGFWAMCAVLESAADFCLGCHMYKLLPGTVASAFVRSAKAAA